MPILNVFRELEWHRDCTVFVMDAERPTVCNSSEPGGSEMGMICETTDLHVPSVDGPPYSLSFFTVVERNAGWLSMQSQSLGSSDTSTQHRE
jgi:hypothetical protein